MAERDPHEPKRFTGGRTERRKDRRRLKAGGILARADWLDDPLVFWSGQSRGERGAALRDAPPIPDFLPRLVETKPPEPLLDRPGVRDAAGGAVLVGQAQLILHPEGREEIACVQWLDGPAAFELDESALAWWLVPARSRGGLIPVPAASGTKPRRRADSPCQLFGGSSNMA